MNFTTNWQSYVFNNMPIGVNNGGSQALFNQYVSQVNQLSVQVVPQGSPNIATLFGYDADNTVDIDNIKVVQLVPGLPPVSVTHTAGQIKSIGRIRPPEALLNYKAQPTSLVLTSTCRERARARILLTRFRLGRHTNSSEPSGFPR